MKKREKIGTISGQALFCQRRNKLNRNDGIVKSGTGYHQDKKKFNRKGKQGQQLKNRLKDYGDHTALFFNKFQIKDILFTKSQHVASKSLI